MKDKLLSDAFEELLNAAARVEGPDEHFTAGLRARLVEHAAQMPGTQGHAARQPAARTTLRRAANWGFGLIGLAALVGVLVFSLRLLPQGPVAQVQPTPSAGLPGVVQMTPTATPPAGQLYIVQAGDTWDLIAVKFGITAAALRDANPAVGEAELAAGRGLIIPEAAVSPTPPAATPTPPATVAPGSVFAVVDPGAADAILLRQGPGSVFSHRERLAPGTRLPLLGRSQQGDWLQVQGAESSGWVFFNQVLIEHPLGQALIPGLPVTSPLQEPSADTPRLSAAACANPQTAPEFAMAYSRPGLLIGGATLQVGDFTFDFWLHCDSVFGAAGDTIHTYSEIAGLGIYGAWFYQGADQPGSTQTYFGIEPYVSEYSGSGDLTNGSGSDLNQGLQFPLGIIPDFSQVERVPLHADMIVRAPDGETTGVRLSFMLGPTEDGFLPVDVQVSEWQGDLDALVAAAAQATPPVPLKDPGALYPVWQDAHARLETWQANLLAGPGWVFMRERRLDGRLTEIIDEQWLQIDAEGRILASTYTQLDANGNVQQQSYMKDGINVSLTYGSQAPAGPPQRLDIADSYTNDLLSVLRRGLVVERSVIEYAVESNGTRLPAHPAIEYAWSETYAVPLEVDGQMIASNRRRLVLDQASGAPLLAELIAFDAQGQESVLWQVVLEQLVNQAQPPANVLALLEMEPTGYQPAAPLGAPAPAGFDASALPLTLQTIPGDSFDRPTFFYGDIFAGGYLLGRVDFGASPGGFCDRSADGAKLAFSYLKINSDSTGNETLRWLALSDVATVHAPAPELYLISKASWAPQGSLAAFSACREGQQDCGLYLLDAATDQVRLLSGAGVGSVKPLWKPDGRQVAFINSDVTDVKTLLVVDAVSGETLYSGPFDTEAWQPAADAPLWGWGVEIARSQGSECFIGQ